MGSIQNMDRLYALGARQRNPLIKNQEEWNLYESALILELDPKSGNVRTCVEYKSPPEARAHDDSSMVFKAGTIMGDTLYACTGTEVLIFKLPEFQRIGYVSLPALNDVHHVTVASDGNLLVANTGLDMVIKFTLQGKVLSEWAVMDEDIWSRFSRDTDYRKVDSTKPHQSHPNFVFELNGEPWVTRFRQRDAICLDHRSKRIDIAVESPHDGVICGDRIYFTTVDGRIVIANPGTLQVDEIVDLKQINGSSALLGWCRGVLPLDERRMWVGFSRVRKTKFRENVLWLKNVFRPGMIEKATHLALYDIVDRRCLREFDLEPYGMNIVFSVLPAVPASPGVLTTVSTQSLSFWPNVQSPTQETYPSEMQFHVDSPIVNRSSSFRKGPLASKPDNSGSRRLTVRSVFSRVLTKPPALCTRAARATTSHSFLGVRGVEPGKTNRLLGLVRVQDRALPPVSQS